MTTPARSNVHPLHRLHHLVAASAARVPERQLRTLRVKQDLRHDLPEPLGLPVQDPLPPARFRGTEKGPLSAGSNGSSSPSIRCPSTAAARRHRTMASTRFSSIHTARSAGVSCVRQKVSDSSIRPKRDRAASTLARNGGCRGNVCPIIVTVSPLTRLCVT